MKHVIVFVLMVSFLHSQDAKFVRLLGEHKVNVTALAFAPDGSILASGDKSGELKIFSTISGKCTATLVGHAKAISQLAFSSDGLYVASGGVDGTVRMWDVKSATCLSILAAHLQEVTALSFSSDSLMLATGGPDSSLRIWDWKSAKLLINYEDSDLEATFRATRILFLNEKVVVSEKLQHFYVWNFSGELVAHYAPGDEPNDELKTTLYPTISVSIEMWKEKMPDGKRKSVYGLSVNENNKLVCAVNVKAPTLAIMSKNADLVAFAAGNSVNLWEWKKSLSSQNPK